METALQVATLHELEERIKAGIQTFIDVGNCLLEIRDRRLYKEKGYTRFEDYCREEWGWSRDYGYKLIRSAETVRVLGVDQGIQTERQARELAPLVKKDEEEAVKVWQELREEYGDNITAEKIRQAVREKQKPEGPTEQPTLPEEEAEAVEAPGVQYHSPDEQVILPESKPHVSYNSGNNEWYTPVEYIEAVRKVMGEIVLDPASSEAANRTIKAKTYYTKEDDGLTKEWHGRVWMNPPYATDLIPKFCNKIAEHYQRGDIPEAIILVNNATETSWFGILIEQASAVVFPRGRVKYWTPEGELGAPLQGQAVIYLGKAPDHFLDEFLSFGWGAKL